MVHSSAVFSSRQESRWNSVIENGVLKVAGWLVGCLVRLFFMLMQLMLHSSAVFRR